MNGDAGGFFRTVHAPTHTPFSIGVAQPPNNPVPAPFAIFGVVGNPDPGFAFSIGIGTMCFPPSVFIGLPQLFLLADSFSNHPTSLLPATLAPWSVTAPVGLPFPVQMMFQGVISENKASFVLVAKTNAVLLDLVTAPAPTISTVSPAAAAIGAPITVTGTGFQPQAALAFGGAPVVPTSVTATQIVFANPSSPTCDTALVVTNADGQAASWNYDPTPMITGSVLPTGPAAGGATFVIQGSGFESGSTVTIGGSLATVITTTASSIVTNTPPGVPGAATVVVTSPAGCIATTTYTYL